MGNKCLSLFLSTVLVFMAAGAWGFCNPRMVNPVTEVNWGGIFPIKIGGVTAFGTDEPDVPDATSSPLCFCSNVPGITVSFWDPFRIIEVVQDPWCVPTMGVQLSGITPAGRLSGTVSGPVGKKTSPHYFAQAHHIVFPVWQILDLFTDIPCVESGDWDVAYFTELDPLWQNDMESMILNPEALVFGNPALQMACMADSVASAAGLPRDELFWCMGQWGSTYPLTGNLNTDNTVMGAAGVAARLLYKLNREMLICDRDINSCGCVRTPIWVKSHYRLQIIRPKVNTGSSIRIGEPSPLWESYQSSPIEKGAENFGFVVMRKVTCCVFYDYIP